MDEAGGGAPAPVESNSAPEAPVGPGNYPAVAVAKPTESEAGAVTLDGGRRVDNAEEPSVEELEAALEEGTEEGAVEGFDISQLTGEQIDALELTITANGEEHTRTVAQLKKDAELGIGAYQKMEEASHMRKQAQSVFKGLANAGPDVWKSFMHRLNVDPLAFAEAIATDHLARAKMTPEQREMADFQRQKKAFEHQQKQAAEQQRQQKVAELQPQYEQHFLSAYGGAMDVAGIPESEALREGLTQRMAERDLAARRRGQAIPPEALLRMEWEALQAAAGKVVKGMPADQLSGMVGEDRLAEMRQARLAGMPSTQSFKRKGAAAPKAAAPAKKEFRTYSAGDGSAFSKMLDEMQ